MTLIQIINKVIEENLIPFTIDLSAEGGKVILWEKNQSVSYAFIECLDGGETCLAMSDREGFSRVCEVNEDNLEQVLKDIRVFIFWKPK